MRAGQEAPSEGISAQRLDRWLWFTRLIKSRTLAASLVSAGKVRVNRERVGKPSHAVHMNDVVTATVHRQVRVLRVAALGTRRGPPAEAQTLYEDLAPPLSPAEQKAAGQERIARGAVECAPGSGRPTKRDRREIDRFKSGAGLEGSDGGYPAPKSNRTDEM